MKRMVYYGYIKNGLFTINVHDDEASEKHFSGEVALTRAECQKIAKHMQFGKKGEERHMETVNGVEVK